MKNVRYISCLRCGGRKTVPSTKGWKECPMCKGTGVTVMPKKGNRKSKTRVQMR